MQAQIAVAARLMLFVTEQRLRRDSHIVNASVPCFVDTGSEASCYLTSTPARFESPLESYIYNYSETIQNNKVLKNSGVQNLTNL